MQAVPGTVFSNKNIDERSNDMACLFGHKWNGCKCSKCGKTRDEHHKWDLCKGKCSICGKTQNEQHDWNGCKCSRCGATRDEQHEWDGCKCNRCGMTRDEQHNWKGCMCFRCYKKRDENHIHKNQYCACGNCGKLTPQLEEIVNQLIAIFPKNHLDDRTESEAFNKNILDKVRSIGEMLNKEGGLLTMQKVGESFARMLPIHARKLENMWKGIGNWQV